MEPRPQGILYLTVQTRRARVVDYLNAREDLAPSAVFVSTMHPEQDDSGAWVNVNVYPTQRYCISGFARYIGMNREELIQLLPDAHYMATYDLSDGSFDVWYGDTE